MQDKYLISGIQQLGIGIPDVQQAFKWYRQNLGMDVKIFEEAAEAALMLKYTGGEPRSRHAILAINLQGGGGFEIWQYTSRKPEAAKYEVQIGDQGIWAGIMKCRNIKNTHSHLSSTGNKTTDISELPDGQPCFYVTDPYENKFLIKESDNWFSDAKPHTGGVYGAMIGVSNMDKAIEFYSNVLGFDTEVYNVTGSFDDIKLFKGGDRNFKRVMLKHSKPRQGAFSRMLGEGVIELIQPLEHEGRKIFENRLWGDLGFIHLCFDVIGMDNLKQHCESLGHLFTVDTANSFDMGEAAGRFSYIEDPDGTLIEFVETHKMPLVKKIGWYLNVKGRTQPLPDWMLRMLRFSRVKN